MPLPPVLVEEPATATSPALAAPQMSQWRGDGAIAAVAGNDATGIYTLGRARLRGFAIGAGPRGGGWSLNGYAVVERAQDESSLRAFLHTPGALTAEAGAWFQGSASDGWGDVLAVAGTGWEGGTTWLRVRGGAGLRMSAFGVRPSGALVLKAGQVLAPGLTMSTRVEVRRVNSEDVPTLLSGEIVASWAATPRIELLAYGSTLVTTVTGAEGDAAALWGLPAQGTREVRAGGRMDAWAWPAIGVEGGGAVWSSAGTAGAEGTLGVVGRWGGERRWTVSTPPGPHTFALAAPEAASVSVVGGFSSWRAVPMVRGPGDAWSITVDLPTGTHEYVYLVDDREVVPPDARLLRADGMGGTNAVLIVEPAPKRPIRRRVEGPQGGDAG